MRLNRRAFLKATAAPAIARPFAPYVARREDAGAFPHGVASGDPLPDRVILWTRAAPRTGVVDVDWRIAVDPAMSRVVGRGTTRTGALRDFTVKVDAGGLEPATTYYYSFSVGRQHSAVGRTS